MKANARSLLFEDTMKLLFIVLELVCSDKTTIDEKEVLCESINIAIVRSNYRVAEDNTRSSCAKEIFSRLISKTGRLSLNMIIGCGIALDSVARTLMNILTATNFMKEF